MMMKEKKEVEINFNNILIHKMILNIIDAY